MDELSTTEQADLQQLEATIRTGLTSFIAVGNALAEINDRKLYRGTHDTFDSFCKDKFGFGRSRGYQLASAAALATEMSTVVEGSVLANEGQSRALAKFPEDVRATVWDGVNRYSEATGKPITAGMIERTGNAIMEFRQTGFVDIGNGTATALEAAVTVQESEATARQAEYQKAHYERKDAQGKRIDPERDLKDRWNKFVKAKPCISCGTIGESEVAHVRSLLSSKTGDALPRRKGIAYYSAIPLCPECHRTSPTSIHSVGESNFALELGKGQHYLHQVVATLLAEFMLQVARVEVAE